MKDFRVRSARLADASAVEGLSRALGYPGTVKAVGERLRSLLGRDDQRVWVAEAPDGSVCGWLQAHRSVALESGLRVEIIGLVVSEAMRRKGVGGSLVAQAETWASEISAETVVVRSNQARVESHAFYPALGYLASKTQVVYRKRLVI
jgi:N-acetylglutamate synthase-like GNAT family acetyltransferase